MDDNLPIIIRKDTPLFLSNTTFSYNSGTHALYLNGIIVDEAVWTDEPCQNDAPIGIGWNLEHPETMFLGSIDEVRVYNRALTAQEAYLLPSLNLDTDSDGIIDINDNCPDYYNPDQVDTDNNGIGDKCDLDYLNSLIASCQSEYPAPVPRTGQTTSYATGDDGDLQKGVEWPNPRFNDNGDGTVTDNLTGLIWLKNASCFGYRNWLAALDDCNTLQSGECGLTDFSVAGDWRLPNVNELQTLVDFSGPFLPDDHPFINAGHENYSSTSWGQNSNYAFCVHSGGRTAVLDNKSNPHNVWPVRGPVAEPPTLIELSALEAKPSSNEVTVKWRTESEDNNAGFHVWRAEGFMRITEYMIPGEGDVTLGFEYEFIDDLVFNGKRYFYLLEDVDNEGISTFHGPVKARPRAIVDSRSKETLIS